MKYYEEKDIKEIENLYLEGKSNRFSKIFHQNMIGFRKAGIKYFLSDYELSEYVEAYTNILYFAEKILRIELYDFQKNMLEQLHLNNKSLNLVSRQIGSSLVLSIFYLHKMIFNNDYKILYISNKKSASIEFITKIKQVYLKLPFFLKIGILGINRVAIKFENGSKIVLDDNDEKFNSITISEFAHIYNSEEVYQKYKDNDKLFIFSQPNGMGFLFDLFQETKQHKNDFKLYHYYWWQVPNRDDSWKKKEIYRVGSEYRFYQDYDLQFLIK